MTEQSNVDVEAAASVEMKSDVTKSSDDSDITSEGPQPREFVGSLIKIKPGYVIVFQVTSKVKRFSKHVSIQNVAKKQVLYKIKTTSRDGYRVKPIAGVIPRNQKVYINISLLPHNQYRVSEDRFLVMAAISPDLIQKSNKEKIEQAWKKVLKNKTSKSRADYMEHQLLCAMNMDEIDANESDSPLLAKKTLSAKDKDLLQSEMEDTMEDEVEAGDNEDETTTFFKRGASFKPLPVKQTLGDRFKRKPEPDPHRYDDPTAVQVLRLKKAEDMLQRHIKCSKCFALFVVIVVLLLCAIIIILAVKFPAAVAPTVTAGRRRVYQRHLDRHLRASLVARRRATLATKLVDVTD